MSKQTKRSKSPRRDTPIDLASTAPAMYEALLKIQNAARKQIRAVKKDTGTPSVPMLRVIAQIAEEAITETTKGGYHV